MEVKLYLKKSVDENASIYFDLSKKAKKKAQGARKALIISQKKLEKAKLDKTKLEEKQSKQIDTRKKQWYHKYRWFTTSEGFLVVGGKDATTNEVIIKKHAETGDLVFHTDMAGSPFIIIKNGEKASETSIQEAADFTAAHSKGWKLGMGSIKVFYVKPEQVTKEANTGEFLAKGSFMIRGKTNYVEPTMNYAVGVFEGFAMGGPISAVKANCKEHVDIIQGDEKPSDTAKKIKHKLNYSDVDEIIRVLPVGCKIKKER